MKHLAHSKALALYGQIGIFDAEYPASYPQWQTGLENAVIGTSGIAVKTANDVDIEIDVFEGTDHLEGVLCVVGDIMVGSKGLLVGNVVSAMITHLDWPAGKAKISVYIDKEVMCKKVSFVIHKEESG